MAKRKIIWSTSEINTLLDVMIDERAMLLMDDKTTRNKEVYTMLKNRLLKYGYDRDEDQIKFKFQKLKSEYIKMNVNNNRSGSGRRDDSFYGKMEQIMQDRPETSVQQIGYESRGENSAALDKVKIDTSTSTRISKRSKYDFEDSILEEESFEIKKLPSKTGGSSRRNASYQSVVNTMTEKIKNAIQEETKTLITCLEKMQKEDHKWQKKLQKNDQDFLLKLFVPESTPP